MLKYCKSQYIIGGDYMDNYDYKPSYFDQKEHVNAKEIEIEKVNEKNWEKSWEKDWEKDWDKDCGMDCGMDKRQIYAPTKAHVYAPTKAHVDATTKAHVYAPTKAPTYAPTKAPTYAPTKEKTYAPTYAPTKTHTFAPTYAPTFTIVIAKGVDNDCMKPFMERGTEAMSPQSTESFMETFNAILKKGGEYEYKEMENDAPDNLKDSYETLENQVAEGLKDAPDKEMDEKVMKEFLKIFDQDIK
jgi:hypothetical protein